MNIKTTKLFTRKQSEELTREERVICTCLGICEGQVFWLTGSRQSSLGGYIGTFSHTYVQRNGYSPCVPSIENVPMRYMKAVDD